MRLPQVPPVTAWWIYRWVRADTITLRSSLHAIRSPVNKYARQVVFTNIKLRHLIVSAACLAMFSVSVSGQRVAVSSDPAINFSSFRKYLILESKNPSQLKICHEAILDNLQVALAIRGLLPVYEGETADLFVVYNAGIKEIVSIQGYDYRYGTGMQGILTTSFSGISLLANNRKPS